MKSNKLAVHSWRGTNEVLVDTEGVIDDDALLAFTAGHCHSLALALNKLTGWQIFAVVDSTNDVRDPGHCVVQTDKGHYLDIYGINAIERWEQRHGPVQLFPITPEEARNLETYMEPDTETAMPFAVNLLKSVS